MFEGDRTTTLQDSVVSELYIGLGKLNEWGPLMRFPMQMHILAKRQGESQGCFYPYQEKKNIRMVEQHTVANDSPIMPINKVPFCLLGVFLYSISIYSLPLVCMPFICCLPRPYRVMLPFD
jgi:hypothetical protein